MRNLWAPALVIAAFASATLTAWSATANNGDLMYLESLYHHLFTLGLPWRQFVFTEATFLFPDGLLYFVLRAALGRQTYAAAAYFALNLAVTLALVDALYRRLWPAHGTRERAAAVAFVALAPGLIRRVNLTLFWPNHHGTLLPLTLALLLIFDGRARGRWARAALALVTALTAAADGVALVQVIAPLTLYWAWLRRGDLAAAVAGGAALGLVAFKGAQAAGLLRVHTGALLPTRAQLGYQFTNLGSLLRTWFDETRVFHAVVLGVLLVARGAGGRRAPRRWAGMFALAVGATLLITALMGRLIDVYALRYLLNYFYWATIGTALWVMPRLTARAGRLVSLALLAWSLAGAGAALTRGLAFFGRDLAACVNERVGGAGRHGVAGFWPAKLITFTGGPTVNQVHRDYAKYLWMNAETWYRPGASFVVTDDQVTGTMARAWFGPPAVVVTCTPTNDLLLYPGGLPEPADPARAPE